LFLALRPMLQARAVCGLILSCLAIGKAVDALDVAGLGLWAI
jgi:hypothetical protein